MTNAQYNWSSVAERAIRNAHPQVKQIDFRQHLDVQVELEEKLVPLRDRYMLGPAGLRIRDAFQPIDDPGDGYRALWRRFKDLHTTMKASPEQLVSNKKDALVARYRQQAGIMLLVGRFDTISGWLLAVFGKIPAPGSMWVPVQSQTTSLDEAKALCAWFKSTLGALGFPMGRRTKLANPSFPQAELAVLHIPDFKATCAASLAEAYEEAKRLPVKPWKHAANDDMRDCLDRAASVAGGIELTTIRDWRARISREPTVSNQPTEHAHGI